MKDQGWPGLRHQLYLRLPPIRLLGWTTLLGVAMLPVRLGIVRLFPAHILDASQLSERLQDTPAWVVVLLMPLLEEIVFRWALQGLLLHELLLKRQPMLALLIASILFGAAHSFLPQMFAAGVMGLVLGWVFWRTRSIWAAIYLHVLNNGLVLLMGEHLSFYEVKGSLLTGLVLGSWIILGYAVWRIS